MNSYKIAAPCNINIHMVVDEKRIMQVKIKANNNYYPIIQKYNVESAV